MIVDDMRKHNRYFRQLTQGAQVIRVPFEVCPFTDEPDGKWGLWWREWSPELNALVPRSEAGNISCDWWRPPFRQIVIASDRSERGCLLYQEMPPVKLERDDGTIAQSAWGGMLVLVCIFPNGELIAPHTFGVVEKDGLLGTDARHSIRNNIATNFNLAGRSSGPDFDEFVKRADAEVLASEAYRQSQKVDVTNAVHTFAMTMALLNCKNISTEAVKHDEKLQRSRTRRGLLPLVSWHVLKVGGIGRSGAGVSGNGEPLALHWVRGHFKSYGDKGLFGRHKGTYWWSPHLSGQADRVMLKDYSVGG